MAKHTGPVKYLPIRKRDGLARLGIVIKLLVHGTPFHWMASFAQVCEDFELGVHLTDFDVGLMHNRQGLEKFQSDALLQEAEEMHDKRGFKTMRRHIAYIAALALPLVLPMIAAGAAQNNSTAVSTTGKTTPHFKGDNLSKDAKISLKEARAIALKASPGKIMDEELEVEQGGSGLRYSFVIQHGSAKREVGVDAKTGKVLEDSKEGSNPD